MVHRQLLNVAIVDFNILEFIFAGAPPWTFPPVHICLFMSKMVKASHFLSELRSSALEHAQLYAISVPIYNDGSSSEGVGCAVVFPDFEVFISLPEIASIYRAELRAIFLALSRILFHDSDSFVIYSELSECSAGLWEPLYTKFLSSKNSTLPL